MICAVESKSGMDNKFSDRGLVERDEEWDGTEPRSEFLRVCRLFVCFAPRDLLVLVSIDPATLRTNHKEKVLCFLEPSIPRVQERGLEPQGHIGYDEMLLRRTA
mmetsp:Transcript_20083/g.55862  ORF Transcript_20083/g.55862 Transcript_20083/m.55862 type:complete len:104 (-) Transcript_20083:452-763(-)